MEQELFITTSSYLLLRVAFVAAIAYVFYRVLRHQPKTVRVRARNQSHYADERRRSLRG